MPTPIFKRILLKLSGEALAANQGFGIENSRIHEIAAEIEANEKYCLGVGNAMTTR